MRKTELDREACARFGPTSRAVQLMKSTETKLTAYGRWRCRTSVDNDVILTSAWVVRPAGVVVSAGNRRHFVTMTGIMRFVADTARHNGCAGDNWRRTISVANERRSGRVPLWIHELRASVRTSSLPPPVAAAGTGFFLHHHRHFHHRRLLLIATRRSDSLFECTKACRATSATRTDRSVRDTRSLPHCTAL